jgi:hypothetical protein
MPSMKGSSLARLLNPVLPPPERAVAEVEGWIVGVAEPLQRS